ncbi:MAG TPA: hypothetical protein VIV12_10270 [Streptosporangiaceae bacterium]
MRGRQPNPTGEPLTSRQKRVLAVVGALLLVLIAGVTVWAAVNPGRYGRSHDGCVNVTIPSSTGGAILHRCGPAAQTMCRSAFTRHDRLAMLTRPQCKLAGLAPPSPHP